jgi:hypothetical protein
MNTDIQPCTPSGNPTKTRAGLGMPAALLVEAYADLLYHAFGETPYQVGSSLTGAIWRDVDIRVMLDDKVYADMGFGDPHFPHANERWCAYVIAFSELGRKMTGLPIDFQIQDTTVANEQNDAPRSALILHLCRQGQRCQDLTTPQT